MSDADLGLLLVLGWIGFLMAVWMFCRVMLLLEARRDRRTLERWLRTR